MSVFAAELTDELMFDYTDLGDFTEVFGKLVPRVSCQPLIRIE